MLFSLCPFLLLVFLMVGGSVVPIQATDNEILCGEESDCQATEKVMTVVNENYYKLDEKLDKQSEDLKELKEYLDDKLGKQTKHLEKLDKQGEDLKKHLERLSADHLLHDERLKLHVEPQTELVEVKLNLLGRTATQSSTYTHFNCSSNSGYCVAGLAIDGNYNSNFYKGTCSLTNDTTVGTSWWRVDLGQPFKVQRIMIVNRGDCCGVRLNHFVVGLSNSSAVPIRGNYAPCGHYPGLAANGANLSLQCDPGTASGRYVIVQQSTNGDGYLTICEIEIYVGQVIKRVPKPQDCSDVRARGHSVSGVYRVYPGNSTRSMEMDVYCDFRIPGESWLVFQRRKDGSVKFDRTWNEYANGFGNLNGEFWLGNDKLSFLTMNKRYMLRVELEDFLGQKRYAMYSTFTIRPSTDKYRIILGGYSGDAGDSLDYHNNMMFSTKDQDNDVWALGNCVEERPGGWWFKSCHYSNLNGVYLGNSNTNADEGINWFAFKGNFHSLKATEMKITAIY